MDVGRLLSPRIKKSVDDNNVNGVACKHLTPRLPCAGAELLYNRSHAVVGRLRQAPMTADAIKRTMYHRDPENFLVHIKRNNWEKLV